jgi:hypothetical protein
LIDNPFKIVDYLLILYQQEAIQALQELPIWKEFPFTLVKEAFLEKAFLIINPLLVMSQNKPFNPFDPKSVLKKYIKTIPKVSERISLSLINIALNFSLHSKEVISYIFNFVQLYRHLSTTNPDPQMIDVSHFALNLKKLYVPASDLSDFSLDLRNHAFFIDTNSLKKFPIEQYVFDLPSQTIVKASETVEKTPVAKDSEEIQKYKHDIASLKEAN